MTGPLDKMEKMLDFPLATVTTETREGPTGEIKSPDRRQSGEMDVDTFGRVARILFALANQATRPQGGPSGPEDEREEVWRDEGFVAPLPAPTEGAK
jgi:hypothetical protein